MKKHLMLYDGECGFCNQTVHFIYSKDKYKTFNFAPLKGSTAKFFLKSLPEKIMNKDTVILIENYEFPNPKYHIMGRAVFRILWHLGSYWKILGALFFLPSFFSNEQAI